MVMFIIVSKFPGVAPMAEIRVENLHKAFGDFVAVKDSSFTVRDGEFFVPARPLAAAARRPRCA